MPRNTGDEERLTEDEIARRKLGPRGVPDRGEHRQATKRAAADIEGHSEAAKFSQPGRLSASVNVRRFAPG